MCWQVCDIIELNVEFREFFDVFSEMMVILFCMAAGFLAHKLGYLGGQTD